MQPTSMVILRQIEPYQDVLLINKAQTITALEPYCLKTFAYEFHGWTFSDEFANESQMKVIFLFSLCRIFFLFWFGPMSHPPPIRVCYSRFKLSYRVEILGLSLVFL